MAERTPGSPKADFAKLCAPVPPHMVAAKPVQDAACTSNDPADYKEAVQKSSAAYIALLPQYENELARPPRELARAVAQLRADMPKAEPGSARQLLEIADRVNAYVNNSIVYKSDAEVHGVTDKWQSPAETLRRGTGDCEDYVLLKMALMEKLGFPREKMWLANGALIQSPLIDNKSMGHAALVVELAGKPYALDYLYKSNTAAFGAVVPLAEYYEKSKFAPMTLLNPLAILGTTPPTMNADFSVLLEQNRQRGSNPAP